MMRGGSSDEDGEVDGVMRMEMRMEVMKVMRMEMWQLTAAALYWELQVVSFPGNGRTVGGGRAALPKLNWGVEGRGG